MKAILSFLVCIGCLFTVHAQDSRSIQQTRVVEKGDSIRVVADSTIVDIKNEGEKKSVKVIVESKRESKPKKADKSFAGITFSRFDLGLTKILDDGSLSLSPQNEFLDYRSWKSVNVGFDVLQMGYKFNEHFLIKIAAGFDWTHIRLEDNIEFLKDTKPLSFVESDVDYRKNRFSSSYLRVPLSFELRTKASGNRFHVVVGPVAGILLQGSQKFKSDDGKRKVKDSFNFAPLTYGAFARVGVGSFGVYAKYYFNDMFIDSPDQEGVKNLSFGVMLFF